MPYDICMCGDGVKSYAHSTEHPFVPMADIPDYLNDLNAMHEAESNLPPEQRGLLRFHIESILDQKHYGTIALADWCEQYCATAAQRAEAFLKTIGKWEKTP